MTLRELLQKLNKIAENTDLETDVYIERDEGGYTLLSDIEVEEDRDINLY